MHYGALHEPARSISERSFNSSVKRSEAARMSMSIPSVMLSTPPEGRLIRSKDAGTPFDLIRIDLWLQSDDSRL